MPSRRNGAGLLLALVAGAAFGAAASLANGLSSPFGLGDDVPDPVREVARVVSLVLGPVYAWVLLPLPLGWLQRDVRSAAAGGALGVTAAVLAYYVSDALLAYGLPLDLSSDASALALWTAVGVPGGAVLGALAGAVRRRRSP